MQEGEISVYMEGAPVQKYKAPDCYMMPAYTKVSVITHVKKVETCLLRIPEGGKRI